MNAVLTTLHLPELTRVGNDLKVRARSRPRSADRALAAARIAPSLPLLLIWRVITRASGGAQRKADHR